jgi:RecA-family ATPase
MAANLHESYLQEPISALEILKTEMKEPNCIISNLLPAGLTFLAGRPKIGKSWMALQIAVAAGSGGTILGESTNKSSVLYIAYEDWYPFS